MSVVIVGGNECMVHLYKQLCEKYKCRAKVFTKMRDGLKNQFGDPYLLVLFTNTMSHKMVRCAMSQRKSHTIVARVHSGSMAALKGILEEHATQAKLQSGERKNA